MANVTAAISSVCAPFSLATLNEAVAYLYFFLFPFALLLNGLAAWVSLHLRSTSTFIVYLKNLVASDLILTLMLPPIAASLLPGAPVGLMVFDCRVASVIFYCCMYISIVLMCLISLDRFFKIVRPFGKLLGQSVIFSHVMTSLIWLVSFGMIFIPTFVLTDLKPSNVTDVFCMSLKRPAGLVLHKYVVLSMEVLFWLVSIMIVFCYICITLRVLQSFRNSGSNNNQGKNKTKLRVFLVLFVFFLCFVPLHMVRVPFTIYELLDIEGCVQTWLIVFHKLALWLSTTNTCLDPILYIYLCREFRDKLVEMMKARGICLWLLSGEAEETSQ